MTPLSLCTGVIQIVVIFVVVVDIVPTVLGRLRFKNKLRNNIGKKKKKEEEEVGGGGGGGGGRRGGGGGGDRQRRVAQCDGAAHRT